MLLVDIGVSLGSTLIGAIAGYWGSRHFARESAAHIERVSDAIAHNLRAIVTFVAAPHTEPLELYWEDGTDRLMWIWVGNVDPDDPISGSSHFFKPPNWTEEDFENWKREMQKDKRERDRKD